MPSKRNRKSAKEIVPRELEARACHLAVVAFLRREPFLTMLLDPVVHEQHRKVLQKLIWSDGPALAEQLVEGTKCGAPSVWYAIGKLNAHLEYASRKNHLLRSRGIILHIPRGSKGGRKFGYYFTCTGADGRHLAATEIRERLAVAPSMEGYSGTGGHERDESRTRKEAINSGSHADVSIPGDHPVGSDASDLRGEVLKYLQDLVSDCARLPHYFPKHLKDPGPAGSAFDAIRQKVRVVEDHASFRSRLAGERERLSREGIIDYSPSSMLSEEQEEYSGSRIVPWDERAGERFHQVTILGDPGFGKSWLLRYEAWQLANKAIKQLTGGANIDEIELPILVRLPDLQPSKKDRLEDHLVTLFENQYPGSFPAYLRRQLISNHAILLMDAWDEVRPLAVRQQLQKLLEFFARAHSRTRILVTSRVVGYNETLPPLPGADELELLAFNTEQISSLVRTWFGKETRRATEVLRKLRRHPQSRGLARIPLMLMLMCQSCPTGDFPDRRSDLYEQFLKGLLFDWKRDDRKSYEGDLV